MTISLVKYPPIIAETGFKLIVTECVPVSISPPSQQIGHLIYAIGSKSYKVNFPAFVQTPACFGALNYSLLDMSGGTISNQMGVTIVPNESDDESLGLVLNTNSQSMAGNY